MTDSPEMRWLKSQIPRPAGWRTCPKNKEHHISMHVAVRYIHGVPPDVTRFGEQAVQCSERPCRKVYTLDAARIAELRPHFLTLKAESDRLRGIQRATTMQSRKAAQKQQQQVPPATKPAKKKAREENATGKGKGHNDVRSAAARAPATVIRTSPSAISSSATSTPASVVVHSTPIVAPVEYDEYDPNLFEISAAETRELQVAVYTDHDQPPLEFRVSVRGLDHFDFTSLNAAKVVGAVPEMGQPAAHYMWYSALDDKWLRVGSPVSLRGRGSYMILRNGHVPEDACPGLLGFVVDALKSILDEAGDIYDNTTGDADTSDWGVFADPELLTEDGASSDFGFDVSVPSSPSPSSGNASSPLKRRWTSEHAEEAVVIEEEEKNVSKLKHPRLVGSMETMAHGIGPRLFYSSRTMTGPTRNIRHPSSRSTIVFVDHARLRADQPRFDINTSSTLEDAAVVKCFTRKELDDMAARNPWIISQSCKECFLPVALWGFGWYIIDKEDNSLDPCDLICKACWKYSLSNPRFNWEEDTEIAPECTCPPGSVACQEIATGCELHNVPALTEAPRGRTYLRRHKTRTEVRDDLERLVRRRGLALDDEIQLREQGLANGEPYDLYADDYEKVSRQLEEVFALREEFRKTRLANFRMPPLSPPQYATKMLETCCRSCCSGLVALQRQASLPKKEITQEKKSIIIVFLNSNESH
ncbi:hypothetical protein K438DRAFT_1780012 [Mycena galopus ATCC 62051]|nr:hypothetical protein K438DRAFT_1780012 [Mycena galopus ATCC 62051]